MSIVILLLEPMTKVGQLTLSNLTLKILIKSKPPSIVELYESVSVVRDNVISSAFICNPINSICFYG